MKVALIRFCHLKFCLIVVRLELCEENLARLFAQIFRPVMNQERMIEENISCTGADFLRWPQSWKSVVEILPEHPLAQLRVREMF